MLQGQNQKLTNYVYTRFGSAGDGNVFPGPSLPYGMVKIGLDCGLCPKNTLLRDSETFKAGILQQ